VIWDAIVPGMGVRVTDKGKLSFIVMKRIAGPSEDWQDFVTYVIDAWSKWGDEHAKKWAAKLPPAPRCPL
jgi:hypothetical protein